MAIRVGAKGLGLELRWRYAFVHPGTAHAPTRDAVYLDVGSSVQEGVLDQHQGGTVGPSTAALVLQHPELVYGHLMNRWLERRDAGQPLSGRPFSPVLVTHIDPDFDAIVAIWLVRRLIEDGEVPRCGALLGEYAARVDQGRYRVTLDRPETATHPVHMAVLVLQSLPPPAGRDRNEWRLERGLALVDAVCGDIGPQPIVGPELSGWRARVEFSDIVAALDGDLALHEQDRADGETRDVELPSATGSGTVGVRTWIANKPTRARLNKYWLRATGFAYTILPVRAPDSESEDGVWPRVVLSLDPSFRDPGGCAPTLQGLGRALERAEVARRVQEPGGDTRSLYRGGTMGHARTVTRGTTVAGTITRSSTLLRRRPRAHG